MNNARSDRLSGQLFPRRARITRASDDASGVVGPNAITRIAEALMAKDGAEGCRSVFTAAKVERYLDVPPTRMVDQQEVARLHLVLIETLGAAKASHISREAGRLTGEYLLAKRIPRPVQKILRRLPRRLAAHILVRAIARNAWTFSGSGRFSFSFRPGLRLALIGSPICRLLQTKEPACHYFAGTFERVFREMLGPSTRVSEIECEATGASACLFDVAW
ncbi:MAG: bacteriochlorophyll 4-vinyl reductase [Methylocystis sp.]